LPVTTEAIGEYRRIVTPSGPRAAGSQLASGPGEECCRYNAQVILGE
jgi:hypothetical protein